MIHTVQRVAGALAVFCAVVAGEPVAAPAATIATGPISYVAAFTPAFGGASVPYLGKMKIALANGTVTGTYEGMSVRPDPLDDRITNVTGSISGNRVFLYVGNVLSFTGHIDDAGTLSGTATMNGRLYEFLAQQGSPHGP